MQRGTGGPWRIVLILAIGLGICGHSCPVSAQETELAPISPRPAAVAEENEVPEAAAEIPPDAAPPAENQAAAEAQPAAPQPAKHGIGLSDIDWMELLEAGGTIGYIIIGLSIAMVALIIEHILSIRRGALMPQALAEEVHGLLSQGQLKQAEQACKARPSFLSYMLAAGLAEAQLSYATAEKAMEDAAQQQAARMYRKIEYLSIISNIAPMLGLLGTVWGMILAFMEFEAKANPQVSELAPGIYHALVTTLQGLSVAIPAIAAYAFFRNRVDELVAQTSLMAEHVFAAHRRFLLARQQQAKARKEGEGA